MAVQDNKKVGFLTPIKPVEVSSSTGNPRLSDKQRVQGGQATGGGQGNTNNAGNTGVQSQPFMSEGQAKIANRVGSAISSIATPPSVTQPSIYRPLNNAQEQFKAGLNSSEITPNINRVVAESKPVSIDNPVKQSVSQPILSNQSAVPPTVFKEPDFSKPSISAVASPQDQRVFSTARQDDNLGESKGVGGSVQYAKDSSGNILRRDMKDGSISKLGGLSSMGPNGTNSDGSPLSAKDQQALDNSRQMISDWQDYKERKAVEQNRNMMLSAISQMPPATQRSALMKLGLGSMAEQGDTSRTKMTTESQATIQNTQQRIAARKNAFDEQLNSQKLGLDVAKAQSEAQGRLASQQNDTFKLIGEVDKNLGSTQDKVAVYKSRGMWNPLTIKATYPREKLGNFKTKDELLQNLANDESIDPGDRDDIVFSYFPEQ